MKDINLKFQLIHKKFRDMKLSKKITFFLFLTTIITVFSVGLLSYQVAKRELLTTTQDAILSIQKQGGRNLDDRIDSFKDLSYRILQSSNIQKLLTYSREEAIKNRITNEGLPAVIITHASLSNYTDYAFLRPSSGMVYEYYKNNNQKIEDDYRDELLDYLESKVNRNHATNWIVYDNQIYFVRQIVSKDFEEQGIVCFAVADTFFNLFGQDMEYLKDENLIILDSEDKILKSTDTQKAQDIISDFEENNIENYYLKRIEKTWDREKYTITVLNTQNNSWTIISYFSHAVLLKGIQQIYHSMFEIMVVAILLIILVTWLISKIITRNIAVIEKGLKEYEAGHLNYRISPASYDEIGLLALQLNYMAMRINELMNQLQIKEEEKRKLEIETLQAQINPHFLYNTLGSLKWEAYKKRQLELSSSLDALIQLLRFTIKKADSTVTVKEEIDYIRNYIAIERMRYGNQFEVLYDIQKDAENVLIPGFVLQPIVENCLLHGLDMTKDLGIIEISAKISGDFLLLEVRDNGIGMNEAQISSLLAPRLEKKQKGLNSIGMNIVDKRLRELYGADYETEILSAEQLGTQIILKIPFKMYFQKRENN